MQHTRASPAFAGKDALMERGLSGRLSRETLRQALRMQGPGAMHQPSEGAVREQVGKSVAYTPHLPQLLLHNHNASAPAQHHRLAAAVPPTADPRVSHSRALPRTSPQPVGCKVEVLGVTRVRGLHLVHGQQLVVQVLGGGDHGVLGVGSHHRQGPGVEVLGGSAQAQAHALLHGRGLLPGGYAHQEGRAVLRHLGEKVLRPYLAKTAGHIVLRTLKTKVCSPCVLSTDHRLPPGHAPLWGGGWYALSSAVMRMGLLSLVPWAGMRLGAGWGGCPGSCQGWRDHPEGAAVRCRLCTWCT